MLHSPDPRGWTPGLESGLSSLRLTYIVVYAKGTYSYCVVEGPFYVNWRNYNQEIRKKVRNQGKKKQKRVRGLHCYRVRMNAEKVKTKRNDRNGIIHNHQKT